MTFVGVLLSDRQVHRSDFAVLQGAEWRVALAPLPRHRESPSQVGPSPVLAAYHCESPASAWSSLNRELTRLIRQWLTGDITNLLGSVWQGLIPTVIILALCVSLSLLSKHEN